MSPAAYTVRVGDPVGVGEVLPRVPAVLQLHIKNGYNIAEYSLDTKWMTPAPVRQVETKKEMRWVSRMEEDVLMMFKYWRMSGLKARINHITCF